MGGGVNDEERRDAARLLLSTPLVLAERDPDGHRSIRRHADTLAAMFRNYLGYRLAVEAQFARLYKAGLGSAGRPLLRRSKAAFSPRDYTYLALLCAVLLTSRQQVLLSTVVADVRHAAAEAELDLGDDTLTERRALVHALGRLIEWGAVHEDAGTVAEFADDPAKEALLWIEHEIVRNLLAIPLRDVESAGELIRAATETDPDSIRHAVRRRIVESPVVLVDQLSESERLWLRQYQRREAQILEENFGLHLEIRLEGVMALDPQDELTDLRFPRDGTLGQAALLAVAELVERLTPDAQSGNAPVPDGELSSVVSQLLNERAGGWSKEYVDHPDRLIADVEDLLVDMGLLERNERGALGLRAAAARFAPEHEVVTPQLALEEV
jgi:uncharacterized protein (TIGR02678 family)